MILRRRGLVPNFNPLRRASDRQKTTRTGRFQKVDGLDIFPQSIINTAISGEMLGNITAPSGFFDDVASGGTAPAILTTTTNSIISPEEIKVGVLPFQIMFFEDFTNLRYRIPYGVDNFPPYTVNVAWGDYEIIGPLAEPLTNITGHRAKVIYKTYIYNQSGGTHDIYFITGARTLVTERGQGG
jgi:hypothetical protein